MAEQVRFTDNMIFVFQKQEDAVKFYKALPKGLEKHGLECTKSNQVLYALEIRQRKKPTKEKNSSPLTNS